ncbi:Ig-like domain-containing protein [Eubacterium sp.]|uniref:Ig-like domain-containing protein n=1 Tax=Eubacterium sp. TaxID=142586 RepID=UPI002FC61AED
MVFWEKIRMGLAVVAPLCLLIGLFSGEAEAATIYRSGDAAASEGAFTPAVNAAEYVAPGNHYDGDGIKYYLLTHDEEKRDLESISYDGKVFSLEGVAVQPSSDIDFINLEFPNRDGTRIKLLNYAVPSRDFTIFFDDGLYNDTNSTNYTALSKENASYVGLNRDALGESTATLSKEPRSGTGNPNIDDKMERWIFMNPEIYLENLKFDGKGKDMYPVGGGSGSSRVPKNRGEYFFVVTGGGKVAGCNNFVMRDVVLENIGNDNSTEYPSFWGVDTRNKNVALNILYNPGQVNIENITIRNIKTTEGYGIIQNEYVDQVFYKDVAINAENANPNSRSIKIEQSGTQTAGSATFVPPEEQAVSFFGDIHLPDDRMHNHIYVQDYRYKGVTVPEDFRYAFWNVQNGSYFSNAFEIHQTRPEMESSRALHDLRDNFWIISADSSIPLEEQLTSIQLTMNYAKMDDGTLRAPQGNIKLETSTAISGFKLPENFSDQGVQIVALNDDDGTYDSKALVPVAHDAIIDLVGNTPVILYNFDFHENTGLTLQEAALGIHGLTPDQLKDPLQQSDLGGGDYPKYETYAINLPKTPGVLNARAEDTFINCRFTVLAQTLSIGNIPNGNIMDVDQFIQLSPVFNTGYTLDGGVLPLTPDTIDNLTIQWISSHPEVASIDEMGRLQAHSEGKVTIYLKARDGKNNGEIEKPFDSVELTVVPGRQETTQTIITDHPGTNHNTGLGSSWRLQGAALVGLLLGASVLLILYLKKRC